MVDRPAFPETYMARRAPEDPDVVIVTVFGGKPQRIHREDADPEHSFVQHRLAAGWFDNRPTSALRTTPTHQNQENCTP